MTFSAAFRRVIKRRPDLLFRLMSHVSQKIEEDSARAKETIQTAKETIQTAKDSAQERKLKEAQTSRFVNSELAANGLSVRMKLFSLLPMFQLKPWFAQYTKTILKEVFKDDCTPEIFFQNNFKLTGRAKRRVDKFRINSFTSNGVEVHLQLISEKTKMKPFYNSEELNKAGYSKLKAPETGQVSHEGKRGVFRIAQTRCDLAPLPEKKRSSTELDIFVIDPGVKDLVAMRTTPYKQCDSAAQITKSSSTLTMSSAEYAKASGRLLLQRRESMRRKRKDGRYGDAIARLSKEQRLTSSIVTFESYLSVYIDDFQVHHQEVMTRCRRSTRETVRKMRHQAIDRIANQISGSSSKGAKKKRLVAFGGASFKTKKGSTPSPRKAIIRALGNRRLTFVLNEFKTSKMCPGACGGEMVNTPTYRIRRCSMELGEGGTYLCPLSERDGRPFELDQDASATINMTLSVKACLDGQRWLNHLLWSSKN